MAISRLGTASLLLSLIAFTPIFADKGVPPSASAGVAEKQIQKEYQPETTSPEKPFPLIEIEAPENQLEMDKDKKVFIKTIEFSGNEVFSSEKLQELCVKDLNQELTIAQIQAICACVKEHYVKAGYMMIRVYPPVQQIDDEGVLKIEILEGKLGRILIEGNRHYKASFIQGYFAPLLGKPVHYDQFIKQLYLLNENSDLQATVVFKKGELFGTADAVIKVEDHKPVHFYSNFNNNGSIFNSKLRTGGRLDYGNLLKDGDTLSFTGVGGSPVKHLRYAQGAYTIPVSRSTGASLTGSYIYSDFKVPILRALHLKGRTNLASLDFHRPVTRSKKLNWDLNFGFDYKQLQNFELGSTSSFDKLRVLRGGISLDFLDRWKGRNLMGATLAQGIPNIFDGLSPVSKYCSRLGAGGLYTIFSLNAHRVQSLPLRTLLLINFMGQLSPSKLPLPEQFYIGGADSVRGFASAAALGDIGGSASIELHIPPYGISQRKVPFMKKSWEEFLQFALFFDAGAVGLNRNPDTAPKHVAMAGTGLGFRINGPYHFQFSFDVGFPLTKQKRTSDAITYFRLLWLPF